MLGGFTVSVCAGAVAGDEQSYDTFAELMDPIISGRHGGYGKNDKHPTDLNPGKLIGGMFDTSFVLSCRVSLNTVISRASSAL